MYSLSLSAFALALNRALPSLLPPDFPRVADVSMDDLVKLMIGRDLKDVYPKRTVEQGDVLLEVDNLSQSKLLRDISFQLHAGEIVGFAGIVGSGRTELARAIFGADPIDEGDAVRLRGRGGTFSARTDCELLVWHMQ